MSAATLVGRVQSLIRSPAFVYLAAAALGRLGSIVLIPLYTRRLAPEDYGTLGLAQTVLNVLPLMMCLGLSSSLTKVFFDTPTGADPRSRLGHVVGPMLGISFGVALLLALLVFALWPDDGIGLSRKHALLIISGSLAMVCVTVPDAYFRAAGKASRSAALNLTTFFSNVLVALVLVLQLGRGLDGAIEAACLAPWLPGSFGVLFALTLMKERTEATRVPLGPMVLFSLPFIVHFGASWLYAQGDRWVLKALEVGALLGFYSVAQQLASPIAMVTSAVNDAETPKMGELYRAHGIAAVSRDMKRFLRRYLLPGAGMWLVVLLFIPIARLVLGERYNEAFVLFPLVGLATVIDAAYQPPVNVLFFAGRTRVIPQLTFASAVIGLALTAGLTHAYGVWGLVVARVLSSCVRAGVYWLVASRSE